MRPFLAVTVVVLAASAAFVRADDVPAADAAPQGIQFESGGPAFADVLAKAKAAGKPVFIDFQTEWCGWCRKLEKDVFSQAAAGETMKAFVNVSVDAEKGEGVELAKRYGARGFPTLVVVDSDGAEIDRVVGYRKLDEFNNEMARILRGEGTLPALKKAWSDAPADIETGLKYAAKAANSDANVAELVFLDLTERSKDIGDRPLQAKVLLERAAFFAGREASRHETAARLAELLVMDYADTPAAEHAGARLGRAFLSTTPARATAFLNTARAAAKTPADRLAIERTAVAVHKNAMAAALARQGEAAGDDPEALNDVAWTCFESRLNVKKAVQWARTAVEKSKRAPHILDTLANLLWITGAHEEALQVETEAAEHAEGAMKKEFVANVAKWKAESAAKADEGR
jgi:thioredoxin-related protein